MASQPSRREQYAAQTRAALLSAAERAFSEEGFAAVGLDSICEAAQVTKGALYHHFGSKQGLYRAAYDSSCDRMIARIMAAASEAPDAWSRTLAALRAWLDGYLDDPSIRRFVIEAPTVLGPDVLRDRDEERMLGLVRRFVEELSEAGIIEVPSPSTATHIMFAALLESAVCIATAEDRQQERANVEQTVLKLISGLRPASS